MATSRWQDKDPADVITVEFDFSSDAAAVTSPTVAVAVVVGTDPTPNAMLVGSPSIVGAVVYQRVQGGIAGNVYSFQCGANNGADYYTIEALLPVRTRPVVSALVARYITEAQFEQRFGAPELADLTAGNTSFVEAENDAASLVDTYLAARYTLPLVSVPAVVTAWAGDITRFKLWDERAPTEVRQRYEDALAQLKLLAQGIIALPPDAAGDPIAAAVSFGGYSNDRVFTQCTLQDF